MKCFAHPVTSLLLLTLAFSELVRAEPTEIVAGVLYPGDTVLLSSEIGIEFSVPSGWRVMLPREADLMLLQPDDDAVAYVLISAVSNISEAGLMQLLNQNHPLAMASQLVPVDKAEKQGEFYYQRYSLRGFNPQNIEAKACARLGDNQSAFIAVSLEPGDKEEHTMLVKDLVSSVKFITPLPTKIQDAKINWAQRLGGRTLHYRRYIDGELISRKLNLCSNHTLSASDSDRYVSRDANMDFRASARSTRSGYWQVEGNQLFLFWTDGTRTRYTLSYRYIEEKNGRGLFLDDMHWFNVANKNCY